MLAGEDDPQDIIRSVRRGLYAVNFGGGQVDITNGKFVFSASEAYLIEDGHLTAPVKGATLIGDGPTVLRQVTAVGNDLKLDQGIGMGYVRADLAEPGTAVVIDVRGRLRDAEIARKPLYRKEP